MKILILLSSIYLNLSFSKCSDKVVLVSYNLLGVDNASNHMDLYDNVSPKHLEWSRRKHLICKEISHYNASILCLQASLEVYYIWLHTLLDVYEMTRQAMLVSVVSPYGPL